jgi:transposase-like protein
MDESGDRAESLRLRLAASRDGRRRVPPGLREEAVAFATAERASGGRYKSIATTLGLKPDTLMRWCRARREPKKFARVVVVKRGADPRLTVHGPAGTLSFLRTLSVAAQWPAVVARRGSRERARAAASGSISRS